MLIWNSTQVEVAEACVDIMLMLCGMFPVTDEYGRMMRPLPRARVLLSDMKPAPAKPPTTMLAAS